MSVNLVKIAILGILLGSFSCSKKKGDQVSSEEKSDSATTNVDPKQEQVSTLLTCEPSENTYEGFGGRKLKVGFESDSKELINSNRLQLKPLTAYAQDIKRITGITPDAIEKARASLEPFDSRWWEKTQTNSINLYASFRIAFEAASRWIETEDSFKNLTTPEDIEFKCSELMQVAWLKEASRSQVETCRSYVEANMDLGESVAWSYTVASILSSAEFLSY